MARYAVSGSSTVLLDAVVAATGGCAVVGVPGDASALMGGEALLGYNLPTGRTFWLRSLWALDASTSVILNVFDATVGDLCTGSTTVAVKKLLVKCASGGTLTMVDIPAPGLKFSTGCVVAKDTTDASACFTPGSIGGAGYEEG